MVPSGLVPTPDLGQAEAVETIDKAAVFIVEDEPSGFEELDEAQIRVDLAAAFRLAARFDLHAVSYTHLTLPTNREV